MIRKIASVITSLTIAATLTVIDGTRSKQGAVAKAASSTSKRLKAMHWAKTQKGKPYCYGGEGSATRSASCYDCSGLVMTAYAHAGISLPRTTGGMWGSSRLKHISRSAAHWGDLVFWFSGGRASHVEFLAGDHLTLSFGAHHSGTRIGYRHLYGTPHFAHVVGAG
jgi:peptidoglycan DL-endopeptidase CwlO